MRSKVAKVLFSAVYLIVMGEVYLRVFNPIPMLPRYVVAKEYGVRGNMPNAKFWHRTPDYELQMRMNSRGVRAERDIPYEKPQGTKRIVLLGDSFAVGHGATFEQTFLEQTRAQLQRRGFAVETINMGVSGHGNAEELVMLREEALRYGPDIVIVAWHPTDVVDNVRSGLVALAEDGSLERRAESYLPAVKARELLFSFAVYRWLAGSSHLYNWVRHEAAEWAKSVLFALKSGAKVLKGERDDADTQKEAGAEKPGLSADQLLTVALLREIQREVEAAGATLVILDIPHSRPGPSYVSGFPEDPAGEHFGLRVVSPIDKFYAQGDKLLYWQRSHFHFTPLGNRLVGQLLAEAIEQTGALRNSEVSQ